MQGAANLKEAAMRKSWIFKAAAITACFGFLLLTVPNVNAVEKKAPKFDFKFFKKPAAIISAIMPFFAPLFDTGQTTNSPNYKNNSGQKIKITGTLSSPKVADGD